MFDQKQAATTPPKGTTAGQQSSSDNSRFSDQGLNQNKPFPFKKVNDYQENDAQSKIKLSDKGTEDIFAGLDKKSEGYVERPTGQSQSFNMSETGGVVKDKNSRDNRNLLRNNFVKDTAGHSSTATTNHNSTVAKQPPSISPDLPPGITPLGTDAASGLGVKKILLPGVGLLVIVGLVWFGWRFYQNKTVKDSSFDNLPQKNGLDNVLRGLSSDLKDAQTSGLKIDEIDKIEQQEPLVDSDGDGLTDQQELEVGTNPKRVDTDFDGLSDFDEVKKYLTSPIDSDSDSDGYLDGIEVQNGYNPLGPGKLSGEEGVGWQVYRDEEYGYEIRYPKDWTYNPSHKRIEFNNQTIEIIVVDNENQTKIGEWLENYYQGMQFSDKKFIVVDGYNAVQTTMAPTMGWEVFESHILRGNKVFIIRLVGKTEISAKGREDYNKVISFFKFLD